ncbi:MAG: DnaA-related protein [Caulobacteraceae bacterium]|nr:DnaA-related protein [Caulobacteraceae bacterium]
MNRQLRLPLQRDPSFRREDFVVTASNAEAVRLLDSWPAWPGGVLALVGPEGSGKSHLAQAWAGSAGAAVTLIEDADSFGDDEALFHAINAAPVGGGLLLTSRKRPIAWAARLPDLRSRLNAISVAELHEPDDALLEQVILKLFRERNIRPTDDVLPYMLRRIERSAPAARELVGRIDDVADAEGRAVSRTLVRQILEIEPDTPDLFG